MPINPDIDPTSPVECEHGVQKRFCHICRGTVDLAYTAQITREREEAKKAAYQDRLKEAAKRDLCSECGYALTRELVDAGVTLHAGCANENTPYFAQNPSKPDTRPSIDRNVVRLGNYHPETSYIAGMKALPNTGTKRRILYDLILSKGDLGLCDHEIEAILGWLHQSASAARNSLMNDGWVRNSGKTRLTPQKHPAIVWVAVK